jgi:hypothetical protein
MIPLNMTKEKAKLMTGVFGCSLQEMPFTYLGLPMENSRPRVEHYAPLMNRMERQLTSISSMLNHAGILQLVNSVMSASPTYTMCQSQFMNISTEPGDTTCGETQTTMVRISLWWLGRNAQSQREKQGWE